MLDVDSQSLLEVYRGLLEEVEGLRQLIEASGVNRKPRPAGGSRPAMRSWRPRQANGSSGSPVGLTTARTRGGGLSATWKICLGSLW